MPDVVLQKRELRKTIKGLLRQNSEVALELESISACKKICETTQFKNAKIILAYNAIKYECDPKYLVEAAKALGKTVAFPLCTENRGLCLCVPNDENAFITGAFGIKEPDIKNSTILDYTSIDLTIVPAIAYDKKCNRLGRGGGYYDRLLSGANSYTAGLVFDIQLVEKIPKEAHDCQVDAVFTPTNIYFKG